MRFHRSRNLRVDDQKKKFTSITRKQTIQMTKEEMNKNSSPHLEIHLLAVTIIPHQQAIKHALT